MNVAHSAPLGPEHQCEEFSSGQPELDRWLRTQALRAQQAGTARTYVWTSPESDLVVAHYSVAPTLVLRGAVPRSVTGGYSEIPAYLLARLALDSTLQGQGLGQQLLLDALEVVVDASRRGGGRLIVVDAIDDAAAAFYAHHDFLPVRGTSRLVMKVSTAAAALGAP